MMCQHPSLCLMVLIASAKVVVAASSHVKMFAPGDVVVEGEIGRRMVVTLDKMLCHTDIEGSFARHFKNRKSQPEVPGGFVGYGMFLDALVKAAAHGIGGEKTVDVKTRILAELATAQSPDGQITIFKDKPGFWDAHEGAYLIQAYVNDYRWYGCLASLGTACRLADSLIARKVPKTLGSETAFLLLAEATKDEKYRDWLCGEGMIEADIDVYDRSLTVNGVQHVYTWLARAFAQLSYDPLLCAASDAAFRRARRGFMSVTGSITGQPHWGEQWDDSQVGLGKWGETCASAYLMRLSSKRMESDPRPYYGDLYERVMYNAFFSAQSSDGLKYRYWTPFNESPAWYGRDTYCCPNNYKREVFEIPDAVFYRGDDCLVVNIYTSAMLRHEVFDVVMKTDYPDEGEVNIRVKMNASKLRLRIPAWCSMAEVRVGCDAAVCAPSGWFDIVRDFKTPVNVRLMMPMPARIVRGTKAQEGLGAVLRGPCVYALDPKLNGIPAKTCDMWEIDADSPLEWDAARNGVLVTAQMPNQKHDIRRLLLTRYSAEGRERTFFQISSKTHMVEDELTQTAHNLRLSERERSSQ